MLLASPGQREDEWTVTDKQTCGQRQRYIERQTENRERQRKGQRECTCVQRHKRRWGNVTQKEMKMEGQMLKSKNSGWREGHMYNDTDGQMDEHIQTERKKKKKKDYLINVQAFINWH